MALPFEVSKQLGRATRHGNAQFGHRTTVGEVDDRELAAGEAGEHHRPLDQHAGVAAQRERRVVALIDPAPATVARVERDQAVVGGAHDDEVQAHRRRRQHLGADR